MSESDQTSSHVWNLLFVKSRGMQKCHTTILNWLKLLLSGSLCSVKRDQISTKLISPLSSLCQHVTLVQLIYFDSGAII